MSRLAEVECRDFFLPLGLAAFGLRVVHHVIADRSIAERITGRAHRTRGGWCIRIPAQHTRIATAPLSRVSQIRA